MLKWDLKSFTFVTDEFDETLLHISFLIQDSEYGSPFESDNKSCHINKDKRKFSWLYLMVWAQMAYLNDFLFSKWIAWTKPYSALK